MISLRITPVDTPSLATTALSEEQRTKLTLLQSTLEAAVPLWCLTIETWSEEYRAERAAVCSQAVAEHGDMILYRGKKAGQSADAFNRLAEGIALASLSPGGIRVLGLHFEATET